MHHDDDRRIESWLARLSPPPSADLEARILFAARHTPQRAARTLGDWLRHLFADCHLPSPSYALAAMLALGLGLGMVAPAEPDTDKEALLWSAPEEIPL